MAMVIIDANYCYMFVFKICHFISRCALHYWFDMWFPQTTYQNVINIDVSEAQQPDGHTVECKTPV